MTLGTMILQTSVKISIFLRDLYNPATRGYIEVCLCVALGLREAGRDATAAAQLVATTWTELFLCCCGG